YKMAIYKIENLNFTYSGGTTPVLNNISLQIEEGGFYIICGKSGSGKSTLLKLLKKELSPKGNCTGDIYYNNINLKELDNHTFVAEIGFVGQDVESNLVCDKVWKELAFGLGNLGYSDEFIGARVAEVSEYFGISKWYNRKISELSGGNKQILAVAAVMAMTPKVLLLDEPTSMLDPIAKKSFVDFIARINKELGVTIIVVEHNMENLFDIASNIIVLDNGRVVANERPSMLAENIADKEYAKFIGLTEFAEIFAKLGGKGKMPCEIKEKRTWLKDNFVVKNKYFDLNNDKTIDKKDIVLSAEKLYFRYEKKGNDIIKGASIDCKANEIICLLGGNGGGKTTFANLLTGVYKPYSGKVKLLKNKKIAMLPQNAKGLFVEESVQNEMYVTAKLLRQDKMFADNLIERFELKSISNSHPYDISGGEVQQLALAKLFLTKPDIIILDEPTQGMDMQAKEYLKEFLFEHKNSGGSVIVVTHDLRFAANIGDRIGLFFDGNITGLRRAEEFFENNSLYTTECSLLTKDFAKGLYNIKRVIESLEKIKD
ncbi:MAG: ATP-binding cassette domain-containing protein, partial [Clostridia bacterium]|nr:ATP-binding cassette domain-containing protein [Clostridia bacterium]